MSLINKMLVDLEARKEVDQVHANKPWNEDLRPATGAIADKRAVSRWVFPVVFAALLLPAGVYAWKMFASSPSLPASAPPATQVAAQTADIDGASNVATPSESVPAPDTIMPPPVQSETAQALSATSGVPGLATPRPKATVPAPVAETETVPAAQKIEAVTPARKPKPVSKPKAEPAPSPATPTAIARKERALTMEEKAENAYRLALGYLKQGQNRKAEPVLRDALLHDGTHTKARALLAGMLLETGRWADAAQTLTQGMTAVPSHYPFAQLLARIHIEHGAEQQALTVLEQGAPYAQGDPEFLGFLAALYQRADRHAEAISVYRQALAMRPHEARWWVGVAISLEAEKSWASAEQAYARAQESEQLTPALKRYVDGRLAEVRARKK